MHTIHVNRTAPFPQPATTVGYATADDKEDAYQIARTARLHLDLTGQHPAGLTGWTPVVTDLDELAALYADAPLPTLTQAMEATAR